MERKAVGILCIIIASILGITTARAESLERRDSLSHRLSWELRPAYNHVQHYAMRENGKPINSALSAHLRYAFSFNEESSLGELYPATYQGVGMAVYTLFHPEVTGRPTVAYILQGGRIADIGSRLSIGYEWNLGASWGWKPNKAMNSRVNVMINVAMPITWRVGPHWELSLTPDYTHFSNGDTSFSNSGANIFGVRLGATYLFDTERVVASAKRYIAPSEELAGKSFAKHMTYDIMLYGGWRADRFMDDNGFHLINEAFPLGGVNVQPLYHLNRHFGIGASLDLQVDSSLNLYDGIKNEAGNTIGYSRPPLWQQIEAGISIRGEIQAPIFALGVGIGVNMLNTDHYDYSPIYTTFSLKAMLTQRFFLYVGYRFNSKQYTHNLMYGVGLRF